ncbi:MAG TPA: superoxide dismutase family protein [Myxococcales bacterium]|nr:superoxide dismutase family protein [Myxococcales bacterium]
MHTLILAALLAQAQPASTEVKLADGAGKPVGTAKLTQTAHGVLIAVELHDMKPGSHAIHLHETGKCEGPAFKSAGGHFNPAKKQHGFMTAEGPHAGDLPNIEVGPEGHARAEFIAADATMDALQDADGSALVIHAKQDDYKSQPAGDAGDRVACGVISK